MSQSTATRTPSRLVVPCSRRTNCCQVTVCYLASGEHASSREEPFRLSLVDVLDQRSHRPLADVDIADKFTSRPSSLGLPPLSMDEHANLLIARPGQPQLVCHDTSTAYGLSDGQRRIVEASKRSNESPVDPWSLSCHPSRVTHARSQNMPKCEEIETVVRQIRTK